MTSSFLCTRWLPVPANTASDDDDDNHWKCVSIRHAAATHTHTKWKRRMRRREWDFRRWFIGNGTINCALDTIESGLELVRVAERVNAGNKSYFGRQKNSSAHFLISGDVLIRTMDSQIKRKYSFAWSWAANDIILRCQSVYHYFPRHLKWIDNESKSTTNRNSGKLDLLFLFLPVSTKQYKKYERNNEYLLVDLYLKYFKFDYGKIFPWWSHYSDIQTI